MNQGRPLRPGDLPAITPGAAAAHRRLLRSSHPHLRFSRSVTASQREPGWWLVLTVGTGTVHLQMPADCWPDWQPGHTGADVPEALLAAGMEQSGAPLWQAIARATGAPVHLQRARWLREAPAAPADALAWRLQGSAWHGSLHLSNTHAWQAWSTRLPEPAVAPPLPHGFGAASVAYQALCVPVVLEIGRTRLPLADLARLRRHAVLLIDTPALPALSRGTSRAHPVRVLAGRGRMCVAHALWQPPALVLRQAAPAPSLQGATMNNHDTDSRTPSDAASPAEAIDLRAVEVQVRFELARQHWPLTDLAQWRLGEALPLNATLADAAISAWVHERCVASGRLVAIGDKLGLRIDTLDAESAHATASRAAVEDAHATAAAKVSEAAEAADAAAVPSASVPTAPSDTTQADARQRND
jgi:type III secretion system YscQ/HrcQ family protein